MAEIEKRQSPSRFTGEVFVGMRYQSNANLGPPTSSVRLFGQTANLNQQALGARRLGRRQLGHVRHTYDLGLQDKAALETQLTGYANRQFQLSAANVSLLDLTTGPRFQAFQGIFEDVIAQAVRDASATSGSTTRPTTAATASGLESRRAADRQPAQHHDLQLAPAELYPNTRYLPTNSQFTGTEYSATRPSSIRSTTP